jgi:hypothetical protein
MDARSNCSFLFFTCVSSGIGTDSGLRRCVCFWKRHEDIACGGLRDQARRVRQQHGNDKPEVSSYDASSQHLASWRVPSDKLSARSGRHDATTSGAASSTNRSRSRRRLKPIDHPVISMLPAGQLSLRTKRTSASRVISERRAPVRWTMSIRSRSG